MAYAIRHGKPLAPTGITLDDLVIETFQDENRWTWHKWTCPCGCLVIAASFDWVTIDYEARRCIYGHIDHDRQIEWNAASLAEYNGRPNHQAWIDEDGQLTVRYDPPPPPSKLSAWLRSWWRRSETEKPGE